MSGESESKLGAFGNMALEGVGQALTDHKTGRPPFHTEGYAKRTVIMTDTTREFVEDTVFALRNNKRKVKSKVKGRDPEPFNLDLSKFIRGVLLGVKQANCGLENTGIRTEEQLAKQIRVLIEKGMKAG